MHVWSGNVPGLAIQSLVSAFLVKSASLGKVASEEPLFATLLAESIHEVDERLADCLAVTYWRGGDERLESVAFERADAVIAYGTESAIGEIRRRVPERTRFVPYGHKLSFGAVGREVLSAARLAETVDRAAYDVAKYDQQGCLSPHLFYVETGGEVSPRAFAEALSERLAAYSTLVPRGRLSLEEATSVAGVRQRHELRELAGEPVTLFATHGSAVLFDEDPTFEASCLNRTIFVKPVSNLVASSRRWSVQSAATCRRAASPRTRIVVVRWPRRLDSWVLTAFARWAAWATSPRPGITMAASRCCSCCAGPISSLIRAPAAGSFLTRTWASSGLLHPGHLRQEDAEWQL